MSECSLQEKHIEIIADMSARLKNVENQVCDLSDMKENLKLLTYLQQKQEERDAKYDEKYEQQMLNNSKLSNTLENINNNLTHMSEEIKATNSKVDKLECKFNDVENKNTIDIRDVQKEEVKKKLSPATKVGIGGGILAGIVSLFTVIFEVIKNLTTK